ncbi:RNA-directed DNA polymerase from mobile element jockey, partial [Araneus ventricosus]
LMGKSS